MKTIKTGVSGKIRTSELFHTEPALVTAKVIWGSHLVACLGFKDCERSPAEHSSVGCREITDKLSSHCSHRKILSHNIQLHPYVDVEILSDGVRSLIYPFVAISRVSINIFLWALWSITLEEVTDMAELEKTLNLQNFAKSFYALLRWFLPFSKKSSCGRWKNLSQISSAMSNLQETSI